MIRRPPSSTLFPSPTLFRSGLHGVQLCVRLVKPLHGPAGAATNRQDRKSTRLNSSHANISYAVFCLKKKKKRKIIDRSTRLNSYVNKSDTLGAYLSVVSIIA